MATLKTIVLIISCTFFTLSRAKPFLEEAKDVLGLVQRDDQDADARTRTVTQTTTVTRTTTATASYTTTVTKTITASPAGESSTNSTINPVTSIRPSNSGTSPITHAFNSSSPTTSRSPSNQLNTTSTTITTPLPSPTDSEVSSSSTTESDDSDESADVTFDGCHWIVPGAGRFNNKAEYTFNSQDGTLPDGLMATDYLVEDQKDGAPYNHRFTPTNVGISDGFLNLLVEGGQNPTSAPDSAVNCAEIQTTEQNILYASVRTNAMFSEVPGTCHGLFFYRNDNAEIDIELLTDPNSQANNGTDEPIPLWYSNQATIPGQPATQQIGLTPDDYTTEVHEYRIDWTRTRSKYFVDGEKQMEYTTNVPTLAGAWIWNNWANGDPAWSVGPPDTDNVLQIQSIVMYYNTTNDQAIC